MNSSTYRGSFRTWRILVLLIGGASAIELVGADRADAQAPDNGAEIPAEFAPRPTRPAGDASRRLERLKWLAKQRSWGEFADLATELLAEDVPGWILQGEGHYIGVREGIHRQIAALPAEGLAAYRQRVDGLAANWLQQGLAERDDSPLRKIVQQAFCSRAGADALWALGDMALERGDYTAARHAWRQINQEVAGELLAYPDSSIELAAVRARLALVSIREGSFERADREIAELEHRSPNASGRLAGADGNYVARLRSLLAEARETTLRRLTNFDWPTLAGSDQRTNVSRAHLQQESKWEQSWSAPINEQPQHSGGDDSFVPPPGFPIVIAGSVIYQDVSGIHSLPLAGEKPASAVRRDLWKAPANAPAVRAPTVSAKDGRLFAVVPSRAPDGSEWSVQLIGLDLSRDGALFFQRSPETAGAVFVGAPLIDDSHLIVAECAVSQGVRMAVACYDMWSGEQLWRRELGLAYTPLMPSGAPVVDFVLSADSGIVYANTNAGMIAAVQAADGEPLWLRTYNRAIGRGPEGAVNPPVPHPAVLSQGRLLACPDDSTEALCFDPVDGRVQWRIERPAGSRLLAVDDRWALLTGDRLWRINLEDGKLDPDFGGELSAGVGQGIAAGKVVFWPTAGEILMVDRAVGAPTSQALALPAIGGANVIVAGTPARKTSREPGDYYVVATGSTHITAYRRSTATDDNAGQK